MINAMDTSEGKKIRLNILLAINEMRPELYDPDSFRHVPLELMPHLFELIQQDIKYTKSEVQLVPSKNKKKKRYHYWRQNRDGLHHPVSPLNSTYEIIKAYNTPLLFARGAGVLKAKKRKTAEKAQRRKRRKIGDTDDDDDHEPWIPSGYKKNGNMFLPRSYRRTSSVPIHERLYLSFATLYNMLSFATDTLEVLISCSC